MQNEQILCGFSANEAGQEMKLRTDLVMECHWCANLQKCVGMVVITQNRYQARKMMEVLGEEGEEGALVAMLRSIPRS
jgi:hypothetical protein